MDKATEVEWWAKVGEKFLIQILVLSVILILRFHWILFLKLPGHYQMLSCVWLFETPWTVACQSPLSMGILQARIPEWVAMPSSRGSSQPMDQTQVSSITSRFFSIWATREAQEYWSSSLSPLQGIFLTQELKQSLIHCRQIFFFFFLTRWVTRGSQEYWRGVFLLQGIFLTMDQTHVSYISCLEKQIL